MKYCIDCRWFEKAANYAEATSALRVGRCMHRSAQKPPDDACYVAPIFPAVATQFMASTQRGSHLSGDCGPDARHFEAAGVAAPANATP